MKKMMVVLAVAALSLVAQANYCVNGDFDDGTNGWSNWGNGMWMAEPGVLVEGWTNNACFGQDTGHLAMADSVYTLTARIQSRAEQGGQLEGVTMIVQDVTAGWVDIVPRVTYWFSDFGDTFGTTSPWRDFTITFDTSVLTGVVGHSICVAAAVAQDGRWHPYGNIYCDSMTLIPEPATMALLGLGALVLRKRSK